MCLSINLDNYTRHINTEVAYKVLMQTDDGEYRTPFREMPAHLYTELVSDRDDCLLYDDETKYNRVILGIHVFLSLRQAQIVASFWDDCAGKECHAVVRASVKREDFVASGLFHSATGWLDSAVYTKVQLHDTID